jgi:hypothetical protein
MLKIDMDQQMINKKPNNWAKKSKYGQLGLFLFIIYIYIYIHLFFLFFFSLFFWGGGGGGFGFFLKKYIYMMRAFWEYKCQMG